MSITSKIIKALEADGRKILEEKRRTPDGSAKNDPVYRVADALTRKALERELEHAGGLYRDYVRKALGRSTSRALSTTEYGAKLHVARTILKRNAKRRANK
jgi:hypothetical protein